MTTNANTTNTRSYTYLLHAYRLDRPTAGVTSVVELPAGAPTAEYDALGQSARQLVAPANPDGATWRFLRIDPWTAEEFPDCLRDEWLAGPDGMGFAVYPTSAETTDEQIDACVRDTYRGQDVVGRIRVIRPTKFVTREELDAAGR